ncbi:MAG: Flp pilus assembly complex ATPase component TadA [Rhodospirillaceae bacterium]|nr:Flp pilus assembly complex ATPase component TadA [Rhodospirillaceae bacterium]
MNNIARLIREPAGDVYLQACLGLLRPWLDNPDVTEILVNRPGEIWIEDMTRPGMQRIAQPDINDHYVSRLAAQIARVTHQGINRENPLLSATLPDGARVQLVGPPAAREHWAMAIRRHRQMVVGLDSYARPFPPPPQRLGAGSPSDDPISFLRHAVKARATILISGGTSTGKTTFLNALLCEIDPAERIVLVEDTPEIILNAPNSLGLIAVKGEMGEARVTADDLLQASLRLRPDRIVLGELRGKEAVSFLRAINTGHPGSFSTIHANSPAAALEQLALIVMQTGIGLSRLDTIAYAKSVIDYVVQLDRTDGRRGIAEIASTKNL